jgi:hypothetical protein
MVFLTTPNDRLYRHIYAVSDVFWMCTQPRIQLFTGVEGFAAHPYVSFLQVPQDVPLPATFKSLPFLPFSAHCLNRLPRLTLLSAAKRTHQNR